MRVLAASAAAVLGGGGFALAASPDESGPAMARSLLAGTMTTLGLDREVIEDGKTSRQRDQHQRPAPRATTARPRQLTPPRAAHALQHTLKARVLRLRMGGMGGPSVHEHWMFVGPGLDGPLAVKPIVTEALGARFGAKLGALAVHVVPFAVTVAFHPLPRVTPDGMVQVTVQLFQADAPELVTVSAAWKPPCHVLVRA